MELVPEFVESSDLLQRAYLFAEEAHHGQRRRGDTKLEHVIEAAGILHEAGYPEYVVAAALLHDVVEDTDKDVDEIERRFGPTVAELVRVMTEDESIEDYEERKAEHRARVRDAGHEATAIFVADKLASARAAEPRKGLPARKAGHYRRTLEMARESYPDIPFLDELESRLAELPER
jgi:guanosine-3',5'-bis(diphosphate) 3'-pyrophosphohydrolase